MNKQGGFMSGEVMLLIAAFLIALVGVYKYVSAENNDFDKLNKSVQAYRGDIKVAVDKIDAQEKRIDELELVVTEFRKVAEEAIKDTGEAQDHLAKMRDSQIDLRDRSYPRTVEFKITAPTGPIPIEIYSKTPVLPKKKVTRTVTQKNKSGALVQRSETRESALIGDPNKFPTKKAVKKTTKKTTKKAAPRKKSSGNGFQKIPKPLTLPGLEESKRALAKVMEGVQ